MVCPRRDEVPHQITEPPDHWRDDNTCSYCGSLHPDIMMEQLEAGAEIGPTDKGYKAYLKPVPTERKLPTWVKFYYRHFSEAQMKRFVEMVNEKKMNIGYPGRFYKLPFFIVRGA